MKTEQRFWTAENSWQPHQKTPPNATPNHTPELVLAFGSRDVIENKSRFEEIKAFYPRSNIIMSTTAGEIIGEEVIDHSCVVTAISFDRTSLAYSEANLSDFVSSRSLGQQLAHDIPLVDLKHVFVLSDGHDVNGSELVKGLHDILPQNISVTGGLAGDADRFEKTLVGLNKQPAPGNVVAVGFYGPHIKVGHGSQGGWDSFGPHRLITKSSGNVLHELDGQPALNLYKKYLGDLASELPGSALQFPLSIQLDNSKEYLVRTVLRIDETTGSMTFAGDMPMGAHVRLMKANMDRLVDAAGLAANDTYQYHLSDKPELAILISCVGRKLVLDQRVEEEVENVMEIVGPQATCTGFYSYGEISPFSQNVRCELHNQTMTITTFSEN